MMKGTEEAVTSSRDGGAGRGTRKKVPTFTENDKENFNTYGEDVGLNENKSPLPVGYPRAPLQDITAVLRPSSNNSDEEDPNTGGVRKPVTRSQGLRKMGNVHTIALSERISKNVYRAGPSKTRKKQVMKIAVDESKIVTLPGEAGHLKQETSQLTLHISSSVNLEEQGQKTEEQVRKTEEQRQKPGEQRQKPEEQEQKTEEQRRRKPLSERSSVSRFR